MIVLDAVFEKSAPRLAEAPPADLPEVCFVGRSNVGKSSALNALTNRRQLARVSKTPGRTRLLNFFRVDLADRPGPARRTASMRFCDLPGYGFATGPKDERATWGEMISTYLRERERLVAIVVLIDALVGPQPKDYEMMGFLSGAARPILIAATKADRLPKTRRGAALDRIARDLGVPRAAVLAFSSQEYIGQKELLNELCAAGEVFGRTSIRLLESTPPDEPEAE